MSLPKLDIPTFETMQPSTGKKVKFRPFLVKEHKTLLIMKDSSDEEVSRIMQEIVDLRTFNKLNVANLPNFDLEYLFAKIRAKSIGEIVDLILTCNNCEHRIPFKFNIDELQVTKDERHSSKIMITDSVGVEMKYPTFNLNLYSLIDEGLEKYFDEIQKCLKAVYTTDGKYFEVANSDKEEIDDFISSMTSEQFAKIEEFFLTMPRVSHVQDLKCDSCGATNKARVEGLSNFFV